MADAPTTPPPAPGTDSEKLKKPAPTFYAIIALKLLKGLLFAGLALVMYTHSDSDLPEDYKNMLQHLRVNPERRFWADLAIQLGQLTEKKVILAAEGTLIYSMFSLVEGIGLMFRISWIGWMTIGESAFFIPIEIYELVQQHRPESGRASHPLLVLVILAFNILVVWYLFQNRKRLFRHHHRHHPQ